jgi:hypothetical protein
VIAIVGALSATAHAQPGADVEPEDDEVEPADRELTATLGVAMGGMNTPGGLRIAGSYLYQLADADWFEGGLALTGAPSDPVCFRDRTDELICDHGAADGGAVDLFAGVRRYIGVQDAFQPWLRPGVAVRVARFPEDDLTGVALVGQAAAGVRARVTDLIAVGGMAALDAGAGLFTRGLGPELQLGLVIGVNVDFAMR